MIDERTVLVFDEFIVNHNWEKDEYRALENSASSGASYEVLLPHSSRNRWSASSPAFKGALRQGD